MPIIQVKKLRLREIKQFASNKWGRVGLNSGLSESRIHVLLYSVGACSLTWH